MVHETEVSESLPWRIILFLAGDSPRSQRARGNLDTMLKQVDYEGHLVLEEVDVLREPARAYAKGLLVTPAALLIGPDGAQEVLYGDLGQVADQARLLGPLTNSG